MTVNHIVSLCLIGFCAIIAFAITSSASLMLSLVVCLFYGGAIIFYMRWHDRKQSIATEIVDEDAVLRAQSRVADGLPDAVIICNKNAEIIYANTLAQQLYSINRIGLHFSKQIKAEDVRALISNTLAGQKTQPLTHHIEAPVERHVRILGSALSHETNPDTIEGAIIVISDITDLVRVNTMRADFLANASHELKTPVASLLGYIETLRGHAKDDPKAQEMFLGIMQQQAERMQRLIDDLLSLRRIEITEHNQPTETADFYLAALAAMEAVQPLAEKRRVTITYNGPKDVPVPGRQDELVQLVLNLLDNAVMISAENQTVDISLELTSSLMPGGAFSSDPLLAVSPKRRIVVPSAVENAFAMLRIRDYGPGFAPEHLPRIGERFYKIAEHQKRRERGTGLGLAIVKHITRRHRGGLFVVSAEGVGTCFTICLPRALTD